MPYKVIHIINSLDKINYGIWNAALLGSDYLHIHNVISVLWVCSKPVDILSEVKVPVIFIGEGTVLFRMKELLIKLNHEEFLIHNTIIVTHGSWGVPSRIGYDLKGKGYKWIYTPHGMLEPWSMSQKKLKKMIYFMFFEKRWALHADMIRAVSETEKFNLSKIFKNPIVVIENGLDVPHYEEKPLEILTFLFMARLHFKKGVLPLVIAWSKIMKDVSAKLIIAGPDEGEFEKIKPYLSDSIQYVGAVYGEEKKRLLRISHYYILPSYSEGFPTSVVEAMGYGLIPLISEGCNFPSVFANNLGYKISPEENSIAEVLKKLKDATFNQSLSRVNHNYILSHNSVRKAGEIFFELYQNLLTKRETN